MDKKEFETLQAIFKCQPEAPKTDKTSNSDLIDLLDCPTCGRAWQHDTEQAACIRLFSECIVCRVGREKIGEIDTLDIEKIQTERSSYISSI